MPVFTSLSMSIIVPWITQKGFGYEGLGPVPNTIQ